MAIKKYKLFENIAFVIFFLIFSGYHVLLMIVINLFGHEATIYYSISIRIIIIFLLLLSFTLYNQTRKKHVNKFFLLFYIFSLLYLYRILHEIISGNSVYHIETYEYLLFFMSFVFLPFVLIGGLKVKIGYFDKYENAIIYSGLILSLLTMYYYGALLGTDFVRINYAAKLDLDLISRVFSPLSLSYASVIIISVSFMKLFFVKDKTHKVFLIATILFSMIPFYLGASRGSVFALMFGFIIFIYFFRRRKLKLKFITISLISIPIIIIIGTVLGSGIYVRTINITHDIEIQSLQSMRLDIWKDTVIQFQQNPIVGKYLENINYNYHPHNILLEALISTGVIGFTLLITLLISVFYISTKIIKDYPRYSYISVIFYQSLTYSMLSGGMYKAIWLFVSMVMVIKFYYLTTTNGLPPFSWTHRKV